MNVIPNFILEALKDEDIIITGLGEEKRNFTFVEDIIGLLVKLALSEFQNGDGMEALERK